MKADLAILKAFSDETRLRILFLLSERELCVCEIVAVLRMPQGKVSRHLSVLRSAGLVRDRREGLWVYYSLAPPDSPLGRRLVDYLKRDRDRLPTASNDSRRLASLACSGEICVPRPVPRPAR